MSTSRRILSAAIGFAAITVLSGPSPARAAADRQDPAQGPTGAPVQAAAMDVAIALPVKGMTRENQRKALDAVEALTVDAYVCPHCKGRQAMAGTCAGCDAELRHEKVHVVSKAEASAKQGVLSTRWIVDVTVAPGEQLALSVVEEALMGEEVLVDRDDVALTGAPVLVFHGADTEEETRGLETALWDAELFESLVVSFDERTRETRVEVRVDDDEPPTFEDVAAAGDDAETPMTLVDLIWSAPQATTISAGSASDD